MQRFVRKADVLGRADLRRLGLRDEDVVEIVAAGPYQVARYRLTQVGRDVDTVLTSINSHLVCMGERLQEVEAACWTIRRLMKKGERG